MKKSLIALAVLAASGGAMAQSSVTLYGLVDAGVAYTSTTTGGVKTSQPVVVGSGANNSRWGFRGTEDLGGGLKANFVLESGFNTDDGTAVGVQFGRQAFVGLESAYGTVSLGHQYTAYFALFSATNNLYDTNLATTRSVWGNGIGGGAVGASLRASNSIAYTSPVFNGFSGAAVYGFGEDKNAFGRPTKASYNASFHVKYANGPVLVGFAYDEQLPAAPAIPALGREKIQNTLFAGSYDFGVAKLTGGFNLAKQDNSKDKEFQLGVSAPIGAAASVAAGYAYSKNEVGGVDAGKARGLSLLGTYSLSKRTTLYAGLSNTNFKNGAGTTLTKTSVVAAGVRHTF